MPEPHDKWDDHIRIGNSHAEVVVVPKIGRAVSFRKLQGPETFFLVDYNAGKARRSALSPYLGFGGLYSWLGPQRHWQFSQVQRNSGVRDEMSAVPFDGMAHDVIAKSANRCSIFRTDDAAYKISMIKDYELVDDKAKLLYTVTITNNSDATVRWSIWNLAAVKPTGRVVFRSSGIDTMQFLPPDDESAKDIYQSNLRFYDDIAVLDFDGIGKSGKKLLAKPHGDFLLQYVPGQFWLQRRFKQPQNLDIFTDNGSQIEIWTLRGDDGVFELEILSNEVALLPGTSFSWLETFEILSVYQYRWSNDVAELKRTVDKINAETNI
jgi:hypothetical protein